MRQYEMTYLISDSIGEAEMTAASGGINGLITEHKGKLLGEENWGRRKLAYKINKQEFATYITLNFELDPAELVKLQRELGHSKQILRQMIIVKGHGKESLKLTADEIAEAEDIEAVVGGQRSFEMIEGETEESYGLMSKREENDDVSTQQDTAQDTAKNTDNMEVKEDTVDASEPEETIVEEIKAEEVNVKPKRKAVAKKTATTEAIVEKPEPKKTAKKPAKKVVKPKIKDDSKQKAEAEADRLAKLDEEIEGILGDDL